MIFGHFEDPFAGAGADVQDTERRAVTGYRGAIEVTATEQLEEVVHDGESVLFFFVVRKGVLPVPVGVIAAAIFVAVVSDRAGEGEVGAQERFGVDGGVVVACLVGVRLECFGWYGWWGLGIGE